MRNQIPRRKFLQTAAMAGGGISLAASGQVTPPREGTVRDKLWLFSNPTNGDYAVIRKRSVMSPFESAVYMGIPNIMMVNEIDVITYWIRRPEDLADQDACLTKLEKYAPHCRIILGVDTFADHRGQTPAWTDRPIPVQQKLCEEALGWLRRGRIEGLIIYGGTTIDVGYQAAEWTREWIQKVGDTKL
jgi:hypothetical protein